MKLLDRAKWLAFGAITVVVTACSEPTATAPLEIDGPSTTLPRLTASLANANVCDDGVALRKPNGTFLKWLTQRKRVRTGEQVEGKPVRQYHTIQFDRKGLQTRDVSCVLAVDEGAMLFLRSYFKQSASVLSEQPAIGRSMLASSSSFEFTDCVLGISGNYFCDFGGGRFAVCFADNADYLLDCYHNLGGSTPPTYPPPTRPTAGYITYTPPNQGGGGGGYYTYYPPAPNECPPTQEVVGPEDTCVITPPPPPPIAPYGYADCVTLNDPKCVLRRPDPSDSVAFRAAVVRMRAIGGNCIRMANATDQLLAPGAMKVFIFIGPRPGVGGSANAVGDTHPVSGEIHISTRGFDGVTLNTPDQLAQILRHELSHWLHIFDGQNGYWPSPQDVGNPTPLPPEYVCGP